MILTTNTRKLQVVLAGAKTSVDCDCVVDYTDITTSGVATETLEFGVDVSTSNGTTAVDLLTAPDEGTQRRVEQITFHNSDTAAVVATFRYNDNGTNYILQKATLAVGDTLTYTDESGWNTLDTSGQLKSSGVAGTGRLLRAPQMLTSGTSYTTPANCTGVYVEAWGGGGGGGGGDTGGSNASIGGGGAAGAYCAKFYVVTASTAYTYAIGAAGAAGAATSAAAGGTGGDTTFTDGVTLITAKGGAGGTGMAAGTTELTALGGLGVIATNGDINAPGAPGHPGRRVSGTVGNSGNGGSSLVGSGGIGRITHGAGADGLGKASGGAGCCGLNGATAQTGGAGTAGLIRVTEYA